MSTATLSSKGQLTLPKDIRKKLGLKRGSKLRFFIRQKGECVMEPATVDIKSLKGSLPKPSKPISLEEMDAAIKKRKRI